VIIHDVFFVDEAQNKTMKNERLQSRASPFKSVAEKASGNTKTQQSFTLAIDRQPRKQPCHYSKSSDDDSPHYKRQRESISVSQVLASVTSVVNLNTSPMSVQRGDKSTWWTIKMKM